MTTHLQKPFLTARMHQALQEAKPASYVKEILVVLLANQTITSHFYINKVMIIIKNLLDNN